MASDDNTKGTTAMANETKSRDRTPKTDAEQREAFVKTASKRTSTAVRALANVAKLPAKGRKAKDVPAIIAALEAAVASTKRHLEAGTTAAPEFTLEP